MTPEWDGHRGGEVGMLRNWGNRRGDLVFIASMVRNGGSFGAEGGDRVEGHGAAGGDEDGDDGDQ